MEQARQCGLANAHQGVEVCVCVCVCVCTAHMKRGRMCPYIHPSIVCCSCLCVCGYVASLLIIP